MEDQDVDRTGKNSSEGCSSGDGFRAWLDCPNYRDPGEIVEISAFLQSNAERTLQVSLYRRNEGVQTRSLHQKCTVTCCTETITEVPLDIKDAPAGNLELALTVCEGEQELLRIEDRVVVGESTPEGKVLATDYRRRFPNGEMFDGTLRELGRMFAFRDMSEGINIEWRGMILKTQHRLSHPKVMSRAEGVMYAYRKWLPNYSRVLEGKAEAYGVPVEVCALAEQILPEGVSTDTEGCLDIAFRTSNGVLLAWNKERRGAGPEGIVYSRYTVRDCMSLHMLAAYGANEAGLCTAGAALNAGPLTDRKGLESVADWRTQGGLIAPGGVFLLLLECRTVAEAVKLIENPDIPFANVGNILLADADGNAVVWQTNGLRRVFRHPEDGWNVHTCTNYPVGDWDVGDTEAGITSHNNGKMREANLARLMKELGPDISRDEIFRILRNHFQPGPICQHKDSNPVSYQTVMSYVIDPGTADIYAAYHYPCQHKYMRYPLRPQE
jgi:hypothetical protein